MTVTPLAIPDVLLIEPRVFGDPRGFFFESFEKERYRDAGLPVDDFVQDNVSYSTHGILRGLHFQNPGAQGKLVQVLSGEVFDVMVDLRRESATYGKWVGETLSVENHRQIWVPPGFAHGFVVTGEHALFSYKVTGTYRPDSEFTLVWNDPEVGIDWPLRDVLVSPKDAKGHLLKDLPSEVLF